MSLDLAVTSALHAAEPWFANVIISNPSLSDVSFSSYLTIADTLHGCRALSLYDLTDNLDVPYNGFLAKRNSSLDKDVVMKSKQELTFEIDLSECFEFQMGHSYVAQVDVEMAGGQQLRYFNIDAHKAELEFTVGKSSHPDPKVRYVFFSVLSTVCVLI